ncbi:MAG: DUF1592 domain-containing protein [Opitutae bacterium]|nr:DUF1592 domain-containing protein [Opitutae bacterium]MBT6462028.1 DUF1592 domain-containing protein [Opitutae bacterium]
MRKCLGIIVLDFILVVAATAFEKDIRPILENTCLKCHGGEKVKGKVDFSGILNLEQAEEQLDLWEKVVDVLETGDMPPEDERQLTTGETRTILDWCHKELAKPIEAQPGIFQPRRLSAPEYRNTLRSLFGFDLKVSIATAEQTLSGEQSLVLKLLPIDPPGVSGFVNDTHGTKLSPILMDQYLHLSDAALEKLFSIKGRKQLSFLMGVQKSEAWKPYDITLEEANTLISNFISRALRRPIKAKMATQVSKSLERKIGEELLKAIKFEMKAILMSPAFLYRGLLMEGKPGIQQSVDSFELAERLSYFLWEDRPDDELTELASSGEISKPGIIAEQVSRMLLSPNSRSLAESFAVQWLGLANIDDMFKNDPGDRGHGMRTQPRDFLHYLFTEERPVMELIDSRVTFVNQSTSGFYGKDRQRLARFHKPQGVERQRTMNQRLELREAEGRGGILTMPSILIMNRGPILRGTWMLRRILGVELGEPPADVPPIKPSPRGQKLSFRERFAVHRENASCSRCHNKIDPLGFALDGYDNNGRYLLGEAQKKNLKTPIDTSGQLPGGETFEDFEELKAVFMTSQRENIVRNIVEQTLTYALCRELKRFDQSTVNTITKNLCRDNGTWKSLFTQIANSLPFRETFIQNAKHEESKLED